jgi:tetratricopeptide (TPR) repeat protein
MKRGVGIFVVAAAAFISAVEISGQAEEICADRGILLRIDSVTSRSNVIFGRVTVKRPKGSKKAPTVVIWLREGRSVQRATLDGSGPYCFEKSSAGGEIVVEVDGQQVGSRQIITNLPEQREDFEVSLSAAQPEAPPGVVSAKFNYQRNEKNAKLYEKALASSSEQKPEKAIEILAAIVKSDPADYIAAATLGSIYYRQKAYPEAERWFANAVATNPEYAPAWISLSQSQYAQKKYEAAITSCKTFLKLDPKSATGFYILGEAYLRTEKGNLAIETFNEAIKLDPIGMAQCHLILADLYDINGLKKLATKEFKAFLAKVPDHPEKKKIEQYIAANPE